jgi:hypothetical protein
VSAFVDFLMEHRGGRTEEELGEALAECVRAVQQTEKAGVVTITVTVKPNGRDGATVLVDTGFKSKLPEPTRPDSLYYVDDCGNLVRSNPRQLSLDGLREVEERRAG